MNIMVKKAHLKSEIGIIQHELSFTLRMFNAMKFVSAIYIFGCF